MRKLSVKEWLVRIVEVMYGDVRIMVEIGDGFSKKLSVIVGVCQGSFFIHVIEAIS